MAASSSSSAAADSKPPKYDVFFSFGGETLNSFTSHLCFALHQKKIEVLIDKDCLEKGDDIERALPRAIKESAISIIIFSKDYARSRWCLDELVHILKCRKKKNQFVLPIFYGISPSYVRKQKGSYAAALVKHKKCFKMEKVRKWRRALKSAADIPGWVSQGKSEAVLVQEVVTDVMRKLESIWPMSIPKGKVGICRQLGKIEKLLRFGSPEVLTLGIGGEGGSGKTTLARFVFQKFSNQFEGTCLLESVKEAAHRKGLVELEKEVFSKLLGEKDPNVYNPFVNVRVGRKKALLVLDDVDNFEHLKRLVGDRDRFGPGSKIIVTSRDLQALNQLIDVTYKVQALDLNEASKLFYWKAFEEKSCRAGYEEISAKVVRYGGGNPSAIEDLGLHFRKLALEDWESELEKLETNRSFGH